LKGSAEWPRGRVLDEGDGRGGDGDDGQRDPYCPGVSELTLTVYKYAGYKPHTSKYEDTQSWTGLETEGTAVEIFHHWVKEMVEQWECMDEAMGPKTSPDRDGEGGYQHQDDGGGNRDRLVYTVSGEGRESLANSFWT
jgi:hypothetical protein